MRYGLTNAGLALIARNILGEELKFTRIVIGQGVLAPEQDIDSLTELIDPVMDVDIARLAKHGNNTAMVGGMISNERIHEGYFDRERALFAQGSDGAEVLYCYRNAGESAAWVPPFEGGSLQETFVEIFTAVGSTKYVTANIVRATAADEIRYDDRETQLGAGSVQEAVAILTYEHRQVIENLRGELPSLRADIESIEAHLREVLSMFAGQGSTSFFHDFVNLNGLQLVQGVWNTEQNRIEYGGEN